MKKVIRLKENDIEGLVKKIMREGAEGYLDLEFNRLVDKLEDEDKISKVTTKFNALKTVEAKKKLIASLKKLVFGNEKTKKPLKENDRPRGGLMYGGKAEIVDEVINRLSEHGEEYLNALKELNEQFPVTKYKRVEPPKYGKVDLPSGVKVRSTVYPTNESLSDIVPLVGAVKNLGSNIRDWKNSKNNPPRKEKPESLDLDIDCPGCGSHEYLNRENDVECKYCRSKMKDENIPYNIRMKNMINKRRSSDGGDAGPK